MTAFFSLSMRLKSSHNRLMFSIRSSSSMMRPIMCGSPRRSCNEHRHHHWHSRLTRRSTMHAGHSSTITNTAFHTTNLFWRPLITTISPIFLSDTTSITFTGHSSSFIDPQDPHCNESHFLWCDPSSETLLSEISHSATIYYRITHIHRDSTAISYTWHQQ